MRFSVVKIDNRLLETYAIIIIIILNKVPCGLFRNFLGIGNGKAAVVLEV